MYELWRYPFDHEQHKSSAPPGWMRFHRYIGYAYGVLYLYFMSQMVPRLWAYQVEFPARTVIHLVLGMSIGILLVIKIAIVKWFKHLESTLVPFLGTALFICTFLVTGTKRRPRWRGWWTTDSKPARRNWNRSCFT